MTRGPMLLLAFAGAAWGAPCWQATAECKERFPMGGERYVTVYRSHPLQKKAGKVRRALVVIHGASRNADDYFASAMGGAFLAGGLEDTIVVAPRFAGTGSRSCEDQLEPGEIAFSCSGDDWRGGGHAAGHATVTAFDVIDELVRRLADKKRYPNLENVVLMGHSAGGQFLSRYAAAAKAEPEGVKVRYVVSNPSSYLYLDAWRPGPTVGCEGYNRWKFGMEKRTGYAANLAPETMRKQLLERDVVYLLGEYDVTPQFGFDTTCGAMAQGPHRLQRGLDYFRYITETHGAMHRLVRVPNCGHNGRCMLVANEARAVLFP